MNPDRWRQIEAVCQRALARAPDDRAGFLDEACASDEEPRRKAGERGQLCRGKTQGG